MPHGNPWSVLTLSLGYTGGLTNQNQELSLGGTLSLYPLKQGGEYVNNMFGDVSPGQQSSGYVCYRGFYLYNYLVANRTFYDIKISLSPENLAYDATYFGMDTGGKHLFSDVGTMSSISDETIAPDGVSWIGANTISSIGNLAPNEWIGVWFKHSTTAGASPKKSVVLYFTISAGVT